MADSLIATIKASIIATFSNDLTNSTGTGNIPLNFSFSLSTTDGTASDKADKVWPSKARSLSGATSETIDVFDFGAIDIGTGAGEGPLGNAITLAEIVAVIIENNSTSTGNLTIGGDGTAAAWNSIFNASDTAELGPLPPGGFFIIGAGADPAFAVADTSNHLLKMASSATLTYDILIIGRSA